MRARKECRLIPRTPGVILSVTRFVSMTAWYTGLAAVLWWVIGPHKQAHIHTLECCVFGVGLFGHYDPLD